MGRGSGYTNPHAGVVIHSSISNTIIRLGETRCRSPPIGGPNFFFFFFFIVDIKPLGGSERRAISFDWGSAAIGFAAAPLLYYTGKAVLHHKRVRTDDRPRDEPLKVERQQVADRLAWLAQHLLLQGLCNMWQTLIAGMTATVYSLTSLHRGNRSHVGSLSVRDHACCPHVGRVILCITTFSCVPLFPGPALLW